MTEEQTSFQPISKQTAITLGMAVVMFGGATAFMLRIPSYNDIRVIVRDEIKPLSEKQQAIDLRITRIEEQVRLIKERMDSQDQRPKNP